MPSNRDVIVHVHLFKNAGTSVARSLEDHFGSRFLSYDKPEAGGLIERAELDEIIEAHPKVQAFTSHQVRPPIESTAQFNYLPLIFVRHPIDRIRSAFEFERNQGEATPSASLAAKTDFAGWIARHRTMRSAQCSDFQTNALTRTVQRQFGRMPRPAQNLINLGIAIEALDQLPAFGVVERYDESWEWITTWLRQFFPEFSPPPVKANTSGRSASLDERLQEIHDEIGTDAYEQLLAANEADLRLYDWAIGKFDRLAPNTLAVDPVRTREISLRPVRRREFSERRHLVIHAGMHHTDVSAIQTWAQHETAALDDTGQVRLLVDHEIDHAATRFEPSVDGDPNLSNDFLLHWLTDAVDSEDRNTRFVRAIKNAAGDHSTLMCSSAGLATLLAKGDEAFLRSLETLALDFDVTVAMYVRPQHDALLSRWLEWGYKSGRMPSEWIPANLADLHYRDTLARVAERAPSVTFLMRPYRFDLLAGGNVVQDFAENILDTKIAVDQLGELSESDDALLPIDMAAILRHAPEGLLNGLRMAGAARQTVVSEAASTWTVPESTNAVRAKELLHRYAHAEFESTNRTLVDAYGWNTDHLIAEPTSETDGSELAELDELLAPAEPALATEYLAAALQHIVRRG